MTLEEIKARVPIIKTQKGEAKKTRRKIIKFFAVLHSTYNEAKALEQSTLSYKTFQYYHSNSDWFRDMMDWYEFKSIKEAETGLRKNIIDGNFAAQKFFLQSKNPQLYGNDRGTQEVKNMLQDVRQMSAGEAIDEFVKMIVESGKAELVISKLSKLSKASSKIEDAIILEEEEN